MVVAWKRTDLSAWPAAPTIAPATFGRIEAAGPAERTMCARTGMSVSFAIASTIMSLEAASAPEMSDRHVAPRARIGPALFPRNFGPSAASTFFWSASASALRASS
jgi:hypothetical protein